MSQRNEILGAVYNCPQFIPKLYKTHNKKVLTHTLYDLLPRRIGLEIECAGHLAYAHLDVVKNLRLYSVSFKTWAEKRYNLFDVNITGYWEKNIKELGNAETQILEHRISFLGYTQLVGLYNILEDMKKVCLPTESGIHMHIEASELIGKSINPALYQFVIELLEKELDNVDKIVGGYKGTYNLRRVKDNYKNSWIAIRRQKGTLEFRTLPMSFDYTTIITWCIELTKIVEKVKKIAYERATNHLKQLSLAPYPIPRIKHFSSYK